MTYRDREKLALRELAMATLADPRADKSDRAAARARLVEGEQDADLERLDPDELGTFEYLLDRVLGLVDRDGQRIER